MQNDIESFLAKKQQEIDNNLELKEKTLSNFGHVITKFKNQGLNTQSAQEKRNKAVSLLFMGTSLAVLAKHHKKPSPFKGGDVKI